MVRRIGLKIQRLISLFRKQFVPISPKNMDDISIEHSNSLHGKSDKASQCSFSCYNEEDVSQLADDANKNIEFFDPTTTTNKRKLSEFITIPEPKKVLLNKPQSSEYKDDEKFNETSYYFENGLRKVYPYYFTFTTHTKGRWVGKSLIDVFSKEFRAHSSDEYERHIEKGSLTINNDRVTADYVLRHNDLLSNVVHRHEVPVTSDKIDIIHIDQDIVVINKPSSIPVHPCGRYRHNSIIFLLGKEYNLKELKTIHRLDRLTSGILMFGRTQIKAQKLEAQIRKREVKKHYVCRVEGKFPETIECEKPIEVVSFKIGVCKVSPNGKECRTSFQLLGYNEEIDTSIVLCKPHQGRMHQIRVHLQYLGYPIKNDPLYNDTIFGPEKGRGGIFDKSDEQLVQDLIYAHNAENWTKNNVDLPQTKETIDHSPECTYNDMSTQTAMELPDMRFDKRKLSVDPYCQECKIRYKDPEPKDLIMYLHAFKYSGPDWTYETPMPVWADVNWKEP